jgi:hypothetical protein
MTQHGSPAATGSGCGTLLAPTNFGLLTRSGTRSQKASRHFDPEIADTDFELLGATASGVKTYAEQQVTNADAAAASAEDHPVSTTLSASCLSAAPNTS